MCQKKLQLRILEELLPVGFSENTTPYLLVSWSNGKPSTYSLVVPPNDYQYWLSYFDDNRRSLISAYVEYGAIDLTGDRCPAFWRPHTLVSWLLHSKRDVKPCKDEANFLTTCLMTLIPYRRIDT